MMSFSLSIKLSQCDSTGTESGNGGQFKQEIVAKKIRLIFEIEAQ